jgi:hypothetical protein
MRVAVAGILLTLVVPMAALGQQSQPAQPNPAQPAPAPAQPAAPAPAAPSPPRTFTAPVGLLINTVRPDRVDDFEKAMGYLKAALASSTNERVREQAKGWRVFKAGEAGPNNGVLYVFVIDPTVTGADYSLGRIFADAYPDSAKLQEVWKLYSGSVTGASLLNLSPLKEAAPAAAPAPAAKPGQ